MNKPTLGRMIASRRHLLGLTQEQAAAKVNCTQSWWALLENDKQSPSVNRLQRVAMALECEARELIP